MSGQRADFDNPRTNPTAYVVASFAGVMLLAIAVIQVLQGIAAVANDEVFVKGINYVYKFDVTTWGWIHIVLGGLAIAVALGILADQVWGYVCGVAIGCVGAIANFAWLPYYPLWAIVLIALNVLVVWSLCSQISTKNV
jgi:hypothetical protein